MLAFDRHQLGPLRERSFRFLFLGRTTSFVGNAMQQEIPQQKLSRAYSYNALGSFVLIPLGVAIGGPISELIGTRETILGATAISLTATLAVLLVRDVRTIERRGSEPLVESVDVAGA